MTTSTERTRNAARGYLRRGASVIPVPPGDKDPGRKGWQKLRLTEDDVPKFWTNGQNVGLLTGEPSGWRVDVDLDTPEAIVVADRFLPPTLTHGRESKPRSHWWYLCKGIGSESFKDVDERASVILEIRANGRQTLVPPSVHPTGERYRWHSTPEPAEIDAEALASLCRELAAAALVARHVPPEGGRHDFALAVAGFLLRPGRLDEEAVLKVMQAAWHAAGADSREAVRDLDGIVRDTAERIEADEPVVGGPTLEESAPGIVKRLSKWWGWGQEDWQEPVPLPKGQSPVSTFDLALLPGPLREWIGDVSKRMQVPSDFAAVGAVVAAASLVGRKIGIYPKKFDDDWLCVPNLWGAVVGPPATLKTPALAEATKPLQRLEAEAARLHAEELADYEVDLAAHEAEQDALKAELKKAAKESVKEGGKREELDKQTMKLRAASDAAPEEPKECRYKTEDVTTEKLGELLLDNPQGLLVFRDELSGFLKNLEKPGRDGDRAFYLEGWTGTGSFNVDRIGRGSFRVPALCVSILGGIQPGPLSSYVRGALEDGEKADGLLQRFQLLVWPDVPGEWQNIDRYPNTEAKNRAFKVFEKLDALKPEKFGAIAEEGEEIPAVHFSEKAQEVFDAWREELEALLRSGELVPPLEAHLAKYRSLMPSLALLFELMEFVDQEEEKEEERTVGRESAVRAAAWCSYLEGHARRLYASAEDPTLVRARNLLAHIRAGDVKNGSSVREVYRSQWAKLASPQDADAALRVLEDHGWVRVETAKTGGRPAKKILLHPSLRGGRGA